MAYIIGVLSYHLLIHWVAQVQDAWLFFSVQSCWSDFACDSILMGSSLILLFRDIIIIPIAVCIGLVHHTFSASLLSLILLFYVPNCISYLGSCVSLQIHANYSQHTIQYSCVCFGSVLSL